jgi:hypothetical protein
MLLVVDQSLIRVAQHMSFGSSSGDIITAQKSVSSPSMPSLPTTSFDQVSDAIDEGQCATI